MKGKYQAPEEPNNVRDKASKAIGDALDHVPDTIHFDRRRKRTMTTFYEGNLEFKASTKELKDALDEVFYKIHVEDVVIPRTDCRSRGYAFVTLSWAKASDIICKYYFGRSLVNSLQIYLREPHNEDDTQSSNHGVSSAYLETERKIGALERRASELQKALERRGIQ